MIKIINDFFSTNEKKRVKQNSKYQVNNTLIQCSICGHEEYEAV